MNAFLKSITSDYFVDILVRLAHHSVGIEGNTISLPATFSIIVNSTLLISYVASLREFYEMENHNQSFDCMILGV